MLKRFPRAPLPIRLMTYNILNGGRRRKQPIIEVLRASRPDVVILQEVYHADFLKDLAGKLGMYPFFATGNRKRRVALLSRFPLHSPKSFHPFPPIWRNVIDAEIEYCPGKTFRLIGIHLMANIWVMGELWRLREAKTVIDYVNRYVDGPCVIAGDFNAIAPDDNVSNDTMHEAIKLMLRTQGNRIYRFAFREFLKADYVDCYHAVHPYEDGFTFGTPHPYMRLDYILANTRMIESLSDCHVVNEPAAVHNASDHYPVMAEFSLAS